MHRKTSMGVKQKTKTTKNSKTKKQQKTPFFYSTKIKKYYIRLTYMFDNRKVIVTLTTIPSRLKNINEVIISLLKQTIKADEIVLSLPLKSLREPNIVYELSHEQKIFFDTNNITILRPINDYGPATKLLGVLERELERGTNTEPLIITVDDDKKYDKNTVKVLLEGWKRHPDSVVARKGGIITFGEINEKMKKILPAIKNQKKSKDLLKYNEKFFAGCHVDKDTCIDIVFGTGGVVYRPSFFCKNIFNIINNNNLFPRKMFLFIDDIYLSAFLSLKKIKKFVITFEKTEFLMSNTNFINKSCIIDESTDNREINPLIDINKISLKNLNSLEATHYVYKFLKLTNPE